MTDAPDTSKRWRLGAGATVFVVVAIMLLWELWQPANMLWNIILLTMTVGIIVAGFWLNIYFSKHWDEIGEARFDTRNKSDLDG
ncbi:hypothetical protein [Parasphingorhabdus sp.]|jgi:uncharacterized membrane protein YgaE (UPF0421/DUF939 family)|uniref:hypothetical protein n=1 Tax=Parasphingorhabdus sp. TaxID=2709688 RepID=UPI003BB0E5D0